MVTSPVANIEQQTNFSKIKYITIPIGIDSSSNNLLFDAPYIRFEKTEDIGPSVYRQIEKILKFLQSHPDKMFIRISTSEEHRILRKLKYRFSIYKFFSNEEVDKINSIHQLLSVSKKIGDNFLSSYLIAVDPDQELRIGEYIDKSFESTDYPLTY